MSDPSASRARSRGPESTPPTRFAREGGRNRLTARRAYVVAVATPVDRFVRVTVSGPDFADFVSSGPADHVRLFFPDPQSGALVAPVAVGPGEDGIVRPEGSVIARDFTPLNPRPWSDSLAIDLDFLQHPHPGPASSWGAAAQVGDELVVVGPRGSKRAPQDAERAVLVVDGTALPSAGRWLQDLPPTTAVELIFDGEASPEWVQEYLAGFSSRPVPVTIAEGELDEHARSAAIDEGTYVFAAGEAGRLIPLRRYLRRERALPAHQVALSGYWKRGAVGFDHHSPIDPDDPAD